MRSLSNKLIKLVAFLPVYTAIVVTATLIVAIFGPSFGGK